MRCDPPPPPPGPVRLDPARLPPPSLPGGPGFGHDAPATSAAAKESEAPTQLWPGAPVSGGRARGAPPSGEALDPRAFAFARADPLEERRPGLFGAMVSGLASMLIHLAVLITLGLWITSADDPWPSDPLTAYYVAEEDRERELETVILDEDLTPGTHLTAASTSIPIPSASPWAPDDVRPPELPPSPRIALDWPREGPSGIHDLMAPIGPGTAADSQASVDDYRQAMDRITQELLRLLAEGKVLVVWCFDQSASMKDDQQEIRARLERVYAELGMTGAAEDDVLMTAVTSFGRDFVVHTERPTVDLQTVREAIDAVPVDPSGEEFLCSAVIRSVAAYREFTRRQDRQMALILVSDESGNPEESETYLEAAIDQAAEADCRVYVLGREAVFGYPLAHVRWVHPQTGRAHQLPIDRGPETAFPAVLQTDGTGPRTDAHPSGFGPYAQSRLAWRTDGIFFLLPSVEAELIGGEKIRYDRAVMREYVPDLRSRQEILAGAQRRPLHKLIWKIVHDLSPQRPEVARMMDLRKNFPGDTSAFRRQVQKAGSRAQAYQAGLERAIEALEAQQPAREREKSRRWQANYDLLLAQVMAYAARVHLYRAALDDGLKRLIVTPPRRASGEQLTGWRLQATSDVPVDGAAAAMLDRARRQYLAVIDRHAGTPWAARAEWELARPPYAGGKAPSSGESGSYQGLRLVPHYRAPRPPDAKPRPKGPARRPEAPTVPIPKL